MIHGTKSGVQVRRFRWREATMAVNTPAYKTLERNGSFEKRGNNSRRPFLPRKEKSNGRNEIFNFHFDYSCRKIDFKKRRRKFFFDGFLFGKYEEKKLFTAKYALSRVTQTVTAYSPPYSSLDQAFVSPAILGWRVSHTAFVSKYIGASLRTSNFFAGGKGRSN